MANTKHHRSKKQQWGQFMTPLVLSKRIVRSLDIKKGGYVLEPSFGDGSFVFPLIEKMLPLYNGNIQDVVDHLYAIEIDPLLYHKFLDKFFAKYGQIENHNFILKDFFKVEFPFRLKFSWIIGNPPFGGTIDLTIQDKLDKLYGKRDGTKIKKETYSFFVVRSVDLLRSGGRLVFICSDSFLTINTMKGLRMFLYRRGSTDITTLNEFSEETTYPMVLLDFTTKTSSVVNVDDINVRCPAKTPNFSWAPNPYENAFGYGELLSDYIVCSSGMTIGKNEYFVRKIQNGKIEEPYIFEFYDKPITLKEELQNARL
ncbi:hypothetical protein LCGC14_0792700, partial [marine sediment metagenome]